MKTGFSIFIAALLIVGCFLSAHSQDVQSDVLLTASLAETGKHELKVEFKLENRSNRSIYVATNPTPVFGKEKYYLLSDKNDRSLLKISSRVYEPPPYYPITDGRRVELKKLNSGEMLNETIAIKFPAKETDPPFYGKESMRRRFHLSEIKKIELTIGYFIEEEGIVDFLKLKPFGWFIAGQETLHSGKHKNQSFLEIQNLVATSIERFAVN